MNLTYSAEIFKVNLEKKKNQMIGIKLGNGKRLVKFVVSRSNEHL
jgi:hypothetical protein